MKGIGHASLVVALLSIPLAVTACEPGRNYCFYRLPMQDLPYANTVLKHNKLPEELWNDVLFHCEQTGHGKFSIGGRVSASRSKFCRKGCVFSVFEKDDRCA